MDMQERTTGKNKLAITFVVLLTLCAPLGYLYFMIVMQVLSYVSEDGLKVVLLLSLIPVLLPVWVVGLCVSVFATWLAILPGSVYGIQVIRMSYKAGKISLVAAILHTILQFFFLTDVLDAMYLAAGKWNRGKKSSFVVGALYLISFIGIIILIVKIRSAL